MCAQAARESVVAYVRSRVRTYMYMNMRIPMASKASVCEDRSWSLESVTVFRDRLCLGSTAHASAGEHNMSQSGVDQHGIAGWHDMAF